jgi:type II secretory pathway predicted ATPase ExeA
MEPVEHLERFGLERDPFRNEPQLEFWFGGRPHVAAGRRLRRCVEQGKELCVLIGPVGSGTTTVARALAEQLDPEAFEVALLVPLRGVDPDGLRTMVARQLGVESPAAERSESMRQLYAHLVALRASGRRAVVGIDEAHTLGAEAMAELRVLLNLEHEEQRLLTLLLIGTPDLVAAIGRDPGLPGRVELQVALEPLAVEEAHAYLAHRLEVAGGNPVLFAPPVLDAIAERASGLPRRLNALADATLFEAHLAERERPTPEDVERAARDLPWADPALETAALAEAIDLAPAPSPRRGAAADDALASAFAGVAALDSLRDVDSQSFAELDLEDDVERGVEEALFGAADEPLDVPADADAFQLDHTVREASVDASLLNPDETTPGNWQIAHPADSARSAKPPAADDNDVTASRLKTHKPPGSAELPPLPDEDELDGLFVDLVDEA